nr:MAG TPA: hypothetical protein [Caudoviricetes sp.]
MSFWKWHPLFFFSHLSSPHLHCSVCVYNITHPELSQLLFVLFANFSIYLQSSVCYNAS